MAFRGLITSICFLILIFSIVSLIGVQIGIAENRPPEKVHEYYSVHYGVPFVLTMFISVGIFLAVSIIILIVKLRRKKRKML